MNIKIKFRFYKYLVYKTKVNDNKIYYLYKRIFLFCYNKVDESKTKDFYQLIK